jgi:MFS family permease
MADVAEKSGVTTGFKGNTAGNLPRPLKIGYFTLEGLNALAAAYYFNYLFFYMHEHFGFGDRNNLLITALYGFMYMFAAWTAGRLVHKYGYFFFLRFGFSVVLAAMIVGGLIPKVLDYSRAAMFSELGLLVVWTLGMCVTWPTLQGLLSQHESPLEAARTAGVYNIIWAVAAALAYLTGGALLDRFGGETLFWIAAGIHLTQLTLLGRLQKMSVLPAASQPVINSTGETVPPLNPRPIAKARTFLHLAWIANPFAYVAIYGMLPVIPKLSEHLGLTPTYAGLVYSVWFWVRLGAFIWFWLWPGWHYRFGLLFGAFLAMIGSFAAILLCSQVWLLITVQVVFGLAVGLIYYSSLFYSMDAGESKGKGGGIHEAAIGLGTMLGPGAGVAALHFFPEEVNAVTWNICALLVVGLVLFLITRYRGEIK